MFVTIFAQFYAHRDVTEYPRPTLWPWPFSECPCAIPAPYGFPADHSGTTDRPQSANLTDVWLCRSWNSGHRILPWSYYRWWLFDVVQTLRFCHACRSEVRWVEVCRAPSLEWKLHLIVRHLEYIAYFYELLHWCCWQFDLSQPMDGRADGLHRRQFDDTGRLYSE